jgi:hypothetical protein
MGSVYVKNEWQDFTYSCCSLRAINIYNGEKFRAANEVT